MMLPPDTEVMCVTWRKIPASRRKRTSPRWYKVARNPPPDKARPIFFIADSKKGAHLRNLARDDLRGHRRARGIWFRRACNQPTLRRDGLSMQQHLKKQSRRRARFVR